MSKGRDVKARVESSAKSGQTTLLREALPMPPYDYQAAGVGSYVVRFSSSIAPPTAPEDAKRLRDALSNLVIAD